MAHRSRLEERLLAILDPGVARRAISSRPALPTALASIGIALAMPTVAVSTQAPPVEISAQEQAVEAYRDRDEDDEGNEPEELTEAQDKARAALAGPLDDANASVREEALNALTGRHGLRVAADPSAPARSLTPLATLGTLSRERERGDRNRTSLS